MRQLLERFRLRRFPAAAVGTAAVLVGSYPLLFIAAVLPDGHDDRLPGSWLFVAAAVAGYAAEVIAPRVATYLVNLLNWVQVGTAVRFVFREAALIVLLARVLNADAVQFAAFTLGLMALHGLRAVYSALAIYVNQRRRLPVVTRNVDLSELRISDPPPRLLTVNHSWKMLFLDVPAVMGGLIADITDDFTWSLAGISLAIVTGVAACAGIAPYARRNRHLGDKARVLRVVNDRIREHAPQVVLYFSGARDAAYQANMWLETLARLDRPAMIIMRERWLVPLLGRTGLPVVCVDGTVDLMNFPVPSARVALYPANTGKNLHMIRIRGVAHVFVGHGDSDKAASSNPFARVYNQVWVAGQAGRDRYLRAGVGVRDDDIVEVGRPQLAELAQAGVGTAGPQRTVLYAPTWEGWDAGDLSQTSLILIGPQIVRTLLADAPQLRVLYKPHPLTGTRDPRAAKAHEKIAAMIADANQARGGASGSAAESGPADATSSAGAAAAAELARIEARLLKLAGGVQATRGGSGGTWPDYAVLSRDGKPDPQAEEEWQQLEAAWHRLYWSSEGGSCHRVITGPRPALYECFNQSDMLISDISSVVSDFIATGKPYMVTNPAGLGDEEFRAKFPSAAAAYLVGPDCAGLAGISALVAADGDDPLAGDRRKLKRYLLGPDSPDAQTRFNSAVARLAERAEKPGAGHAADALAEAEAMEAANVQ